VADQQAKGGTPARGGHGGIAIASNDLSAPQTTVCVFLVVLLASPGSGLGGLLA
jgi:hypothetical protein